MARFLAAALTFVICAAMPACAQQTILQAGPLGSNFCGYDAPLANPAGYHYLCLDLNAAGGGGLITYGAGGGAPTLPFSFNINGSTYQFPFSVGGIVGPATSTVGNVALWNNTNGSLISDSGVSLPSSPLNVGGVLYGQSSSAIGQSSPLTQGAMVLGGGSSAPISGPLGTSTTVYHGNASGAGSFSQITTADIASGAITAGSIAPGAVTASALAANSVTSAAIANGAMQNSDLANMPASTVKGNLTTGSAAPSDIPLSQIKAALNLSVLNSIDYGATGLAASGSTGAISSGSPVFTSSSGAFTNADIGKIIRVVGAGSAGGLLDTTILSVNSSTSVNLASSAAATVSGATYYYGIDETISLQNAVNACVSQKTPLYISGGLHLISSAIIIGGQCDLYGAGHETTVVQPGGTISGFSVNTLWPVSFRYFAINYPVINTTAGTYGIWWTAPAYPGNSQGVIRDMVVTNAQNCVLTTGSTGWVIDNLKCYSFKNLAVLVKYDPFLGNYDGGDSKIINSTFAANDPTGFACVLWISSGAVHYDNNDCLSFGQYGLLVQLASTAVTAQMIVTNNTFDNACTSAAIQMTRLGNTGSFREILINNNVFNQCARGVYIPTDPSGAWISLLSVIANTYSDGPAGASVFLDLNSVSGFIVSNNTAAANTGSSDMFINAGASTTSGIIGPNMKIGSWAPNAINGVGITQIAPN